MWRTGFVTGSPLKAARCWNVWVPNVQRSEYACTVCSRRTLDPASSSIRFLAGESRWSRRTRKRCFAVLPPPSASATNLTLSRYRHVPESRNLVPITDPPIRRPMPRSNDPIEAVLGTARRADCTQLRHRQSTMWRWDQGRLEYFNFENLRRIAVASSSIDLKQATAAELKRLTGLPFRPHQEAYLPWRNYSRVFKLMRIVADHGSSAVPTPVAKILARSGTVTADEFLHYVACSHTQPSPAFKDWNHKATMRWPLLFSLKYLLARRISGLPNECTINEIMKAYAVSRFVGTEGQREFCGIRKEEIDDYELSATDRVRQGRESLKFLAQLSYLVMPNGRVIAVALDPERAGTIFERLRPFDAEFLQDASEQINSLAYTFTEDIWDEPNGILDDREIVQASGFEEGNKSEKTHLVIERNQFLRKEFFARNPKATCDVCMMDTHATYPWSERVLDIHHLLPLSSGVEIGVEGTKFGDIRPVCPTCHRAVHSYYTGFLKRHQQPDFISRNQAFSAYEEIKGTFNGVRFSQ